MIVYPHGPSKIAINLGILHFRLTKIYRNVCPYFVKKPKIVFFPDTNDHTSPTKGKQPGTFSLGRQTQEEDVRTGRIQTWAWGAE